MKLAIENIGSRLRAFSLLRSDRGVAPTFGHQIHLAHEPSGVLPRATDALRTQLHMHARASIDAAMGMENAMNLFGSFAVFSCVGTRFAAEPVVIAADGNR
jgi:hypothetical protein